MFLSRENNRWGKESIERYLKNTAKAAGIIQKVFPHLLRHTRAMHMLEDGVPLNEIQKVLGHKSIGTTQIYAVMSLEQARRSVNEFDKNNKWLE